MDRSWMVRWPSRKDGFHGAGRGPDGKTRRARSTTRAAAEGDLLASAQKRLGQWLAEGTAVIEVKSGYGLDRDTELKMLRAARRLAGATIRTTFLGAHTVPEEY